MMATISAWAVEVGRGYQVYARGNEAVRAQVEHPRPERSAGTVRHVPPGELDHEPHPILLRRVNAVGIRDKLLDPLR
jgi:hypothetical protein